MNQGRSVYLDLCGRSIRRVVGLIHLQVRTVLTAWLRNQLNACMFKLVSDQWVALMLFHITELLRVMLQNSIWKTSINLNYFVLWSIKHSCCHALHLFVRAEHWCKTESIFLGGSVWQVNPEIVDYFCHLTLESADIYQRLVGVGHCDEKKVGSWTQNQAFNLLAMTQTFCIIPLLYILYFCEDCIWLKKIYIWPFLSGVNKLTGPWSPPAPPPPFSCLFIFLWCTVTVTDMSDQGGAFFKVGVGCVFSFMKRNKALTM